MAATGGSARFLSGAGAIAAAMGVMNVATYGYQMVAAYFLGPDRFSAFTAMLNLLMVVSVVSLGLQATAARRISADPQHVAQIEHAVLRVTWRTALGGGLVLLLLAPLVDRVLRLDSLSTALLAGVAAVPLTLMGGQAGTLQGERRWLALGVLYLAAGVPRLVLGTAMLLWRPTEFVAVLGVVAGAFAPVVVGWWALRHERPAGQVSAEHRGMSILRESVHNSQALFAFFALSSVDIVVARNVMPDREAGLYAAGLIVTKAMLFLPQFVVVVAYPAMSTASQRRRALVRSLTLVAVLGAVGSAAAWLLSDVAMVFVGGSKFAGVQGRLWAFAVLGTLLSMLQLLVYSVLARRGRRSTLIVWTALVAVVGLGLLTGSITGLVTLVISVDLLLLVVLMALSFHLLGRPERTKDLVDSA